MNESQIQTLKKTWPSVAQIVKVPRSELEYRELLALLEELIDEVGENEDHALAPLMEVIGALIEDYEELHWPDRSKIRKTFRSTRGTSLPDGMTLEDFIRESRKRPWENELYARLGIRDQSKG